ncbi:MAG: DUF4386 domain-containing protein [Bacteroidetes bacterium]|nr:DUF4386 domain-containing protein [Bacteroidota bacterium]MBI3481702.1 DUF4386 domain-containing protein [Bacteroidota bacterium]
MEHNDTSLKKTARLAGLLYLVWIIMGMYGMLYVSPKIMVKGDVVATANNMLANEFLFRTSLITDLIGSAIWVFMALVFYRLLKQVNEHQAKLLVALVIVQIPVVFIAEAFSITSLMILKGEILKTFDLSQRQDIAMLFLKINDYGVMALEMFWGFWLFPLAILVYRSNFLPRFLGVWLVICGLAYLILSFTVLLLPQYNSTVFYLSIPAFLGELAFMLWLLIMGVKNTTVISEA